MTMTKTRLLQAVCTVALLAAAPAMAQTNTQTGTTGMGGSPNNATAHDMSPNATGTRAGSMGGGSMGTSDSQASMDDGSMRHSKMHRSGAMHANKGDRSQDAAVDDLNDRSYQAAHSGQAFNGGGMSSDTGARPMGQPNGSGSMNDMSGGSMSGGGSRANGGKM